MTKIINLTQHPATADQIAVGVVDLAGDQLADLKSHLNFVVRPNPTEIRLRAAAIARLAAQAGASQAMVGCALWLVAPLERELRARGIEPIYAFSVRETEEQPQPDGSVRKVAVFRHDGFVPSVEAP